MGHRISKTTSSGSIFSRTKISKNYCNVSKAAATTESRPQNLNDSQHNSQNGLVKKTKTESSSKEEVNATSGIGAQQFVIKIQLAKMESGELNDVVTASHSNNNLNVECSVLSLSYAQNIPCENILPRSEALMSSPTTVPSSDSDADSLNLSLNNNNNRMNILKAVPFIDDDGNDLNSSRRVSANLNEQKNFNITVQPLPEFQISNDMVESHRLHNLSISNSCCSKIGNDDNNYNNSNINEKVDEEEVAEEDLDDKHFYCRRKAKPPSTYPCLSKCGDAIKQFLNPSKSSKKQEKERKPPPTTKQLQIAEISDLNRCSQSLEEEATVSSTVPGESASTNSNEMDNNSPVSPVRIADDYHASFWHPDASHLALWSPPFPISTSQQFVVLQYPNAVLRFAPNAPNIHDNTVAATASVRMVATEFEIIGGGPSNSMSCSAVTTKRSSTTPLIHSSSITRERNALSSSGPVFHSQVDYIHCLVPDLDKITKSSFYWGKIDRYEAERFLEGMPEGTFLLRDSAQEEYLFSVTFRKYGRSLHARIEQLNHKFSFDCHDPGVFTASTVTGLLEHYKDPSCVMFFEPMLTIPLHRKTAFSLQQLCRAAIVSRTTYDGISELELPTRIKAYLKEYHYKQRVRVKPLDESFYTMCT